MKYIYLDSNVIQYIKNETVTDKFNGPLFGDFVKNISDKYLFPMSEGHLKDLLISDPKHHDSDITFMKDLSHEYMCSVGQNESIIPVKANLKFEFENIKSEKVIPNIDINNGHSLLFPSYPVNMSQVPSDNLFRPYLEQNKGIMSYDVLKQLSEELWDKNNNPEYYKRFRNETYSMLQNDRIHIPSQQLPLVHFMIEHKEDVLQKRCIDAMVAFSKKLSNKDFNQLPVGEKIQQTYILLDIHPMFRDKMKRKNRPSNIWRDCKNLFFAKDATYYVTEDASTFKKSVFVSKCLKLKLKIVGMNDLMNKFDLM